MAKKTIKKPSLFVTLSDLHIGHLSPEQLEYEYFGEGGLIDKIVEVIELAQEEGYDFLGVFITGDLFHTQLSMNSKSAQLANELINALTNIVIIQSFSQLFILRGTYGHDYGQLNNYKSLMQNYPDKFFIVDTLTTDLVINNYKFLCIPEEYMKNQTEYYKEAFSNKYDILLAHGFLKANCFNKNETERKMPDMPIFNENELAKICRVGIFGHDHHHAVYADHIWYNGSYSRNEHGEEEAKGMLVHYIDDESVETEFVENDLALKFQTYYLPQLLKVEKSTKLYDFQKLVKIIKQKSKECDFLKIKVGKDDILRQPELIELLKDYFIKYGKRIVIEGSGIILKNGEMVTIGSANDGETDEAVLKENSKYEFLNDSQYNIIQKIQKFINVKHGDSVKVELDEEFIRNAISPDSM